MNTGNYTENILRTRIPIENDVVENEVIENEIIENEVIKDVIKIKKPYIKKIEPKISYVNISYEEKEKQDEKSEKMIHILIIFLIFLFLSFKAYEKKYMENDKVLYLNTGLVIAFIVSYFYLKL